MAKRLLHKLRTLTTDLSRKRGRKMVIRPVTDASSYTVSDFEHPPDPTPNTFSKEKKQERLKTQYPQWPRFWRWPLVWLSAVLILCGTGVMGAWLLTTLPPPPDCDRISPLTPDSERLYCAQLSAQSGKIDKLVAALNLVNSWPENHPLYPEAQRKMEEWSQQLIVIAQQKMNQGNLAGAIAIVRKIPVNSPFYPEAEAKITDWQQDWQQGEKIVASVQDAVKAQNWLTASKKAQDLMLLNISYWHQQRLDELMKQLEMEKQAWQELQAARDLAQSNSPIDLDQAIALAGKVNPKSFARAQAQADRNKWSRALVQIAAQRFKQEDYAGVVVMLQRIPSDSSVYEEAQDWIRLGRAEYAAGQDQILAFVDALWAVQQISHNSPLYSQARTRMSLWQSHLQDQMQMEFASAVASFNQPLTFQLAIDQAQLIGQKRPGRVPAQTQIAFWRKEIQLISNRTNLLEARQLSLPGTIASLKAAVAKAEQIKINQPLRMDAQTAIAQWTSKIQTIEDQPILDQARDFAQKGDLIAAIQAGRQIRPGRALYSQAQDAVIDWVAEIQIAEDRPILKAASTLADQGQLREAIQTAAQIKAGRPLSGKAQAAIAEWKSKLDSLPIESAQAEGTQVEPDQAARDQAERDQAERNQAERNQAERDQAERDQAERTRSKRNRAEHYRARHARIKHTLPTAREVSGEKTPRDSKEPSIDTN